MVHYPTGRIIFAQGEPADSLFLLTKGRVWMVVSSPAGKEVTLGIPYPGMFFGHSCLADQARRSTARALTDCGVVQIQREKMAVLLREHQSICDLFIGFLLLLQGRYERAIAARSFDRSERRLVRTLIDLAYAGRSARNERQITGIPQEILAELVGTTRARVNQFMTRLRNRGVIEYARNSILVRPSILNLTSG
jgi:CRP-like cAMP-binding protein